ncbi:MAG: tripartite tricarboxylate transporter substrate binding protein [Burkholderiales bacterium]|nr:tripartite tricarboxylate transporter substrate binding protein [Burkholderiales bacterium]
MKPSAWSMTRLCGVLVAALAGLVSVEALAADAWPSRPIRLVVGFAAGGPTDVIARVLANDLGQSLGQPVVVENRPGATAMIATELVANAAPDGYTLLMSSVQLGINPLLYSDRVKYDPVKSFTPVSLVTSLPLAVVAAPSVPMNSLKELVEQAKAKPGDVMYASSGLGSAPHMAGATLQALTGTQMTHVPFKGNGPALTEVMAGRVTFMFYPMVGLAQQVAASKLKALVICSDRPHPDFPGVPTAAAAGFPDLVNTSSWVGVVAPAGTPKPVIDRLATELRAALAKPAVRQRMSDLGAEIVGNTPSEFSAFLARDFERWAKVISATGMKGQ